VAVTLVGVYHGANPSLGWLLAATRGAWERSTWAAATAALPLGAGHVVAAALAVPVAAVALMVVPRPAAWLGMAGVLLVFGLARTAWMPPRRVSSGMWAGPWALGRWAFVMSIDRGTTLALATLVVLQPGPTALPAGVRDGLVVVGYGLSLVLTLLTAAMWAARWQRASNLHRWWVNQDLIWIWGLIGAGLLMLFW
jgi:hypothetical protein